jgi:cell wall-associated NlpC family hydrolase
MRGVFTALGAACAALVLACPGVAQATAKSPYTDVPHSFWASNSIMWAVSKGWMNPRGSHTFGVGHTVSRLTAARVLASLNLELNPTEPVAADPYTQAVAAGWITAGTGPAQPITQLQFDHAAVRILRLNAAATTMNTLHTSTGWHPALPQGFGVEQMIRAVGARANAPEGFDQWELWPRDDLLRANLASEAFQLAHLASWEVPNAQAKTAVTTALPAWTPLRRAVLGFALRYAGAPYVWGGTSPNPQVEFGANVSGGFDCSGFVWWVMKDQTYTAGDVRWTGNTQIQARTTFQMAADLPVKQRVTRAGLRPGDILFWSSAPNGVNTAAATVYHTGIYLGNNWTINSHGSGDGVTLDYMGPGAGWYHDAFAFGWRVMPMHK